MVKDFAVAFIDMTSLELLRYYYRDTFGISIFRNYNKVRNISKTY